jgi:branched-subunit amino acid aminotransferase/4-amino-4-deoxychorismate lyase
VHGDELWAPKKDNQMQGIPRQMTIKVCHTNDVPVHELGFILTDVYGVDGTSCTGISALRIHIIKVDGSKTGNSKTGQITEETQQLYAELVQADIIRPSDDVKTKVNVSWRSSQL